MKSIKQFIPKEFTVYSDTDEENQIALSFVTIGSDEWRETVLSSDPFEGDFFDGSRLKDTIVKTRSAKAICNSCLTPVVSGTYNRVISDKLDGELVTNRFCQDCCTAMGYYDVAIGVKTYSDNGDETITMNADGACVYAYEMEDDMDGGEPYLLQDHMYKVREENENVLVSKLGRRWFEKTNLEKYQAMME